jgi:N-acetylglucosaminyldiphosphoundecaprenol N-acetyl-beta-D-mannosaminyltransferase
MLNPARIPLAVLGVPLHSLTMDETVAAIEEMIQEGGFHQIALADVDTLRQAGQDDALRQALCSSEFVLHQGKIAGWLSGLVGAPKQEQIESVELVERVADVASRRGHGVFVLGGSEVASQRAAKALRQQYPNLWIVGRYSPESRPLDVLVQDGTDDEMLRRVEEAAPEILLVALDDENLESSRSEKWISLHRDRLNVPVCLGIGDTLDRLAGLKASHFFRQATSFIRNVVFLVWRLPTSLAAFSWKPHGAGETDLVMRTVGRTQLVATIGNLDGTLLEEFAFLSAGAVREGLNMVLDLSQVGVVDSHALGWLMQLDAQMRQRGTQLWLAGVPSHVSRRLGAMRLREHFQSASSVSDALYRTAKAEQRLRARVPAEWDAGPGGAFLDVRVESLQDVCRSMVAVDRSEEAAAI